MARSENYGFNHHLHRQPAASPSIFDTRQGRSAASPSISSFNNGDQQPWRPAAMETSSSGFEPVASTALCSIHGEGASTVTSFNGNQLPSSSHAQHSHRLYSGYTFKLLKLPKERLNLSGDNNTLNSYSNFTQRLNLGDNNNTLNSYPNFTQRLILGRNNGDLNPVQEAMYRLHILSDPYHCSRIDTMSKIRMYNALATDIIGSRLLRNKVQNASQEEFKTLFSYIIYRIGSLMVDMCGHQLVQDIFQRCDSGDIAVVVDVICRSGRLKEICLNVHGSKVMQTLILSRHLKNHNRLSRLLETLLPNTIVLTRSYIGYQVINLCLEMFSSEDTMYIASEIAMVCNNLAMDKIGCHVVQTCMQRANADICSYIVDRIAQDALRLSRHNYGNYVVQCALKLGNPEVTTRIMARLERNIVCLSMNKHGSNVIETCLKECSGAQLALIVAELVFDSNFILFLKDAYGNFVAQTALKRSKEIENGGEIYRLLIHEIELHSQYLERDRYGENVLAKARDKRRRPHPR